MLIMLITFGGLAKPIKSRGYRSYPQVINTLSTSYPHFFVKNREIELSTFGQEKVIHMKKSKNNFFLI